MILTAIIAVVFVILTRPSARAASLLFTGVVALLLASLLGAICARGRERATWGGAALFGWAFLVVAFGPHAWLNAEGLRAPPMTLLPIARTSMDNLATESRAGGVYDEAFLNATGQVHPADASGLSYGGMGQSWALRLKFSSHGQIVQCLNALAFAVVGAAFGRWMTRSRSPLLPSE